VSVVLFWDIDGTLLTTAELRAALERLLADPELRARLGKAAREHVPGTATAAALVAVYEHNVPRG